MALKRLEKNSVNCHLIGKYVSIMIGLLYFVAFADTWTSGTNLTYLSSANVKVGIGLSAPLWPLHIAASGAKTADFKGFYLSNTSTSSTASKNKIGFEISSTGSWIGTSSKNIGLYVSAVTGGTNNYDAVFNGGGNVGIGTTDPYYKLHVNGGDVWLTGGNGLGNPSTGGPGLRLYYKAADNAGHIWAWDYATATAKNIVIDYGNVGIGTTTPMAPLQVGDATTIQNNQTGAASNAYVGRNAYYTGSVWNRVIADNEAAVMGIEADGAFRFWTSDDAGSTAGSAITFTNKFQISKNGNVGIGTTTPEQKLQVSGALAVSGNYIAPNTATGVLIHDDGTAGYISAIAGNAARDFVISGKNITFNSGNSYAEKMRIDLNGKVGIGTTTPAYKLEIKDAGHTYALLNAATNNDEAVWLYGKAGVLKWAAGMAASATADYYIHDYQGATPGTKFLIQAGTGNVGIGTAIPKTKLHVQGTQLQTFNSPLPGMLRLDGGYVAGYITAIDFSHDAANVNPTARIGAYHSGTGSKIIMGTSNNYATGITNEGFTLDQNGNVGIGTIPEPWDATYNVMQIGKYGSFISSSSSDEGGNVILANNYRYDGVDMTMNPTADEMSYLRMRNGNFIWASAAAQTAGPVTPVKQMVLTSYGYLGIGTDDPKHKMHINDGQIWLTGGTCTSVPGAGAGLGLLYDASMEKSFIISRDFDQNPQVTKDVVFDCANVGIGTFTPGAKLEVAGDIKASGTVIANSVKIRDWTIEAPDFVFDKGYNLRPLKDVANYVEAHKHLPDVPSAKQMKKDGIDLAEMNMTLLKKVEELTLYVIQQQKEIEVLKKKIQ